MFPLLALATLAGFAGYQYSKAKYQNKQTVVNTPAKTDTNSDTTKAQNVYNYYTNESENGNTLFNSQQKTKRTLFGSN